MWVQASGDLGRKYICAHNNRPDGSVPCTDLQKKLRPEISNILTTKGCWSRSLMIHRETFFRVNPKLGVGGPEPRYFPQGLKQKLQIINAVHYHTQWLRCVCVCVQITLYCSKTRLWFIYGPFQWDELFSDSYWACLRVFVKQRFPSPLIQCCRSYCSTSLTHVSVST